jgi:hypothetical protein
VIPLALQRGENRTVYDSVNLAAAIVQRFPFITADAKSYHGLRRGPLSDVLWIEDIPQ